MRWGPLLLCGWPGLPGLWYRGQYSSLVIAIGFSILLNLTLVSSFLWRSLLGDIFPAVAWPMVFLIWGMSAFVAYHRLTDVMSAKPSEKVADPSRPDTLFIQAQSEYLGGNWDAAEALLKRQIVHEPRDIESRLMLATMFRHSRRLPAAREAILELEKFDEAFEWAFEIDRERQLIDLIEEHELDNRAVTSEDEPPDSLPSNNDGYVRLKEGSLRQTSRQTSS